MKYKLIGLYVIIILFYVFIEIINNIEDKTCLGKQKKVYKYNDKYYYLYKNKKIYHKFLDIYNKLKHYNIIPKILYKNDDFLLIVSEDSGENLNKSMKINNFKYQINRIRSILDKHNIIHNDIFPKNIVVKGNIIYLIDWDSAVFKNKDNHVLNNCKKLLAAKNNDINSYMDIYTNEKNCPSWARNQWRRA